MLDHRSTTDSHGNSHARVANAVDVALRTKQLTRDEREHLTGGLAALRAFSKGASVDAARAASRRARS